MFTNYLKIAFRHLKHHLGYTTINVLGLAIGLSCCILIMLFVKSEWSYDRFHTKSDRIYRAWLKEVYENQEFVNTQTPIPLGPALGDNIPEVEAYCRVMNFTSLVTFKANKFNESINMVDSNFFQFFDFKLLEGNAASVFASPNSIVITQSLANKYFGDQPALGQNFEIQMGDVPVLYTISGISQASPEESSIKFDILMPHANDKLLYSERTRTSGWTSVFEETYVLVKKGMTGLDVEAKIPALAQKISGDDYVPGEYNVYLQPLTDIHLNNKLPQGNQPVSDPAYAYILACIGLLVLFIACINFVTLSVGKSGSRAVEVGVRKALGAAKSQLTRQFWGEAILLTFISLVIAIILSAVCLNGFNTIANRHLELAFDTTTLIVLVGFVIVIGIVAGVYPALILSSFNPVRVLKNQMPEAVKIGFFRKGLISGQFVASILMIIGTIVIGQQLHFLQTQNLGFDKDRVVIVATNKVRKDGLPLAEKFKIELSKNTNVKASTTSLYSFAEPGWINVGYEDDNKIYRNFRLNAIDADFVNTMNLKLLAGRNFQADNSSDVNTAMLVNETLVREYGWQDPIGQKLPGRFNERVVGVLQDFNFESLHNRIEPMMMVLKVDSVARKANDLGFATSPEPRISIRLIPGDLSTQLASLEQNWKTVAGNQDFDFKFLDESLQKQYLEEARLGTIVRYASILSILIACMGLFGLSTLAVAHRTREIGIRKVLGARVSSIVYLLSKEFIVMILISALIAFPIAWWGLNLWLKDFVFRISIVWWVFLLAGMGALLVAVGTMSIQSIKAALANPVRSLRSE